MKMKIHVQEAHCGILCMKVCCVNKNLQLLHSEQRTPPINSLLHPREEKPEKIFSYLQVNLGVVYIGRCLEVQVTITFSQFVNSFPQFF